MTRRAWLILGWGIILLTVVDAGYLSFISSYSGNEYTHNSKETDQDQENFKSPILSVLSDIEAFINAHETLFIVLSTIAIACFTGTLWRSTSALKASAEKQGEDMQESLRIARESAEAAKKSADITYAAFIAAHRPRIILRAVYFNYPLNGSQIPDVPVKCIFVNIGDGNAEDVEFFVKWEQTQSRNDLPAPILYEDEPLHDGAETTLNSGDQIIHLFDSGLTQVDILGLTRPSPFAFFVIGKVIYRDKLSTRRTTGFCRYYDPQISSFRKLDGSKYLEYEYED